MGIKIEGGTNVKYATTPEAWRHAHQTVKETAERIGVKHVVAGSYAHKILAGSDLNPNDIDVFLMAPEKSRREFSRIIRKKWSNELPDLDLCRLIYYGSLVFDQNGNATLRLKNTTFPVHQSAFQTEQWYFNNDELPLLHPATYVKMMEVSPPSQKAKNGIDILSKASKKISSTQPNLEAFIRYKNLLEQLSYSEIQETFEDPMNTSTLFRFRKLLYKLEAEGKGGILISLKRYIRDNHPSFAQKLRNVLK